MFKFPSGSARRSLPKTRSLLSTVAAVAVAGLLAMGFSQPAFATAPSTGSFNIQLNSAVDDEANPVQQVNEAFLSIYRFDAEDNDWEFVTGGETNSSGTLDNNITGLIPGDQYAVYVDAAFSSASFDSNGWLLGANEGELMASDFSDTGDADSDTLFVATSGLYDPIEYLNPGVTVTGNIYAPDSDPNDLADATLSTDADEVDLYRLTDDPSNGPTWEYYTEDDLPSGVSNYSIEGLSPGSYVAQVDQSDRTDWAARAFNFGSSTLDGATPFTVAGFSDTPTQDLEFVDGGTISGHVVIDPAIPDDIYPEVRVSAYPVDSHNQPQLAEDDPISQNVDLASGNYTLAVAPGTYDLEFQAINTASADHGTYYDQWYNNAPTSELSTPITVTGSGDSEVASDQTVGQGLNIAGTVTASGLGGLPGIDVFAVPTDGGDGEAVTTDANGNYSFTGLPPGSYNLEFRDTNGFYPDRFLSGSSDGTSDEGAATIISAAYGTFDEDFSYDSYSTLTVHVANKAGTSLSGVDVEAQSMTDGAPTADTASLEGVPVTGHPGTYTISGLQQYTHYSLFFDPSGTSLTGTYPQYFGGGEDAGSSDLVMPTSPTTSLDVTLASAAAVSGVVTSSSHAAIKGVEVDLYQFDGSQWNFVDDRITGSTGTYSFANIATGSYTVDFYTQGSAYVGAYAGGASDPDHATSVYVAPGKPAVLNQQLVTGGSITGVVAATAGSPKLSEILVTPVALTGKPGDFTAANELNTSYAVSGSTGKFTLNGLPTGYYALSYSDLDGEYGDTYQNPVSDPTTAVYQVTAGKVTTVTTTIDLPLLSSQQVATVDGSLDTSAVGVFDQADGSVEIDDPSGNFVTQVGIDPDGNFTAALIPGNYVYTSYIVDDDNPQNLFATDNGAFTVYPGDNFLVLPVVAENPLGFTSPPSVVDTSSNTVGTTYTVDPGTWNHQDVQVAYQWMRGESPIYGATGTSYTAQGADAGSDLSVRVTISDSLADQFGPFALPESQAEYATAANPVAPSDELYNTVQPTTSADVLGTALPGQVIHGQPGDWNDIPGATYTYAWTDEDTSEVVSTSNTFTPTTADVEHSFRLSVSATEPGYSTPLAAPDADDFLVLPLPAPTLKVAGKLTSKVVAGNTIYTMGASTWSPSGGTNTYEWYVDGQPFPSSPHTDQTNTFTWDPTIDPTIDPTGSLVVKIADGIYGHYGVPVSIVARKDTSLATAEAAPGVYDSATSGLVGSSTTPVTYGSVLTAETTGLGYTSDSTSPTIFTYQWERLVGATWTKITGATHSTYAVNTSDLAHQLQVVIMTSSTTHAPEPYVSFAGVGTSSTAIADNPAVVTPASTNTNAPLTKIVETVGAWGSTTSVVNTYQWYSCLPTATCSDTTLADGNYQVITGATTSSYIPSLAQATPPSGPLIGTTLMLVVHGNKAGYLAGITQSAPVAVGQAQQINPVVSPSITAGLTSGHATYGVKLTGKSGTFDVASTTMTYGWQVSVDGSVWTDANGVRTGLTYTPTIADMIAGNQFIRLTETASRSGYTASSASASTAYPLWQAVPVPTQSPLLNTTFDPGSWLASSGIWPTESGTMAIGATATYQWFVDGIAVDSPSNSNNSLAESSVTAADSVSVLVTDPGDSVYLPASRMLIAQKGTAPTWAAPTISGTPAYGNTLSVPTDPTVAFNYPSGAMPSGLLTYQWYEGTTAIAHATGPSYAPPTTYIGKSISVKITATSPLFATASHSTVGVPFTDGAANHGSATLSFSGFLHTGSTAAVALTGYASGVAHTYQWQISTDNSTWTNISAATKSSYVVSPSYLGDYLRIVVATTKSGYFAASDSSDSELIAAPATLAPITQPTLTQIGTSGTDAVGTVITASPGLWNVAATTFTYQWFRDGIIIPGVTGTTYTPTGDELGELISVDVTGHAAGYVAAVATPNAVQVSTGAAPTLVTLPKITGSAVEGSTLSVSPGVWSLDGLTVTYQWYSFDPVLGSSEIEGATNSTYTPDGTVVGTQLFVTVTVSRDGYSSKSAGTVLTGVVAS